MSSRIASVRMKRRPLLAAMAVAPVAGMMTRKSRVEDIVTSTVATRAMPNKTVL